MSCLGKQNYHDFDIIWGVSKLLIHNLRMVRCFGGVEWDQWASLAALLLPTFEGL